MIARRYAPLLFALLLSGFMSLMVSGISTLRATGPVPGFSSSGSAHGWPPGYSPFLPCCWSRHWPAAWSRDWSETSDWQVRARRGELQRHVCAARPSGSRGQRYSNDMGWK